jgi:hypothetical protein
MRDAKHALHALLWGLTRRNFLGKPPRGSANSPSDKHSLVSKAKVGALALALALSSQSRLPRSVLSVCSFLFSLAESKADTQGALTLRSIQLCIVSPAMLRG